MGASQRMTFADTIACHWAKRIFRKTPLARKYTTGAIPSWPLGLSRTFGACRLLQTANSGSVQGTLLGIRGSLEGFSTWEMSLVMSAYFVGFLGGSRMAPEMIRRVGHVRVFAALGSFISAVLILYPTVANPWAWIAGRVVIGVGADEIGVNGAYFRVHHFARQGAAPMPIPVLAAIAARTRHIEVGTGVIDMR